MSNYPNPSLKTGWHLHIVVISVIFGLTVIGISATLLNKIKSESITYGLNNGHDSNLTAEKDTLILVISIGIAATLLQLVASIALWCTKDRDSRPLVYGFIGGQIIIQSILSICIVLVVLEHFKPIPHGSSNVTSSQQNQSNAHGHLFWIILAGNIIFHFGAITYLAILVNKRSGYDDTEEMTAVVVHRRIPSRIPKTKRHGIQ